ncbi:hypothetical protein RRG08_012605 [Elysia crispata]|uniref:Uncharacterized protein n=1 Tax=Elysia crispata TaxID=231223 RepID=A0AAE1DVC1_9GAST|nr:hypothetical protein RRG08_012605 [Elysia crispata]
MQARFDSVQLTNGTPIMQARFDSVQLTNGTPIMQARFDSVQLTNGTPIMQARFDSVQLTNDTPIMQARFDSVQLTNGTPIMQARFDSVQLTSGTPIINGIMQVLHLATPTPLALRVNDMLLQNLSSLLVLKTMSFYSGTRGNWALQKRQPPNTMWPTTTKQNQYAEKIDPVKGCHQIDIPIFGTLPVFVPSYDRKVFTGLKPQISSKIGPNSRTIELLSSLGGNDGRF